ncbi:hypothetical protein [Psychroflexus montanilacus]|uniref:hypothetical protein n=1 Tax=Psychroflexus montanilacus TaxID=2873598 RepID=UPI001CC9DCD4|nr:hypothetical protein [Psychroflexus montanilacus]MBZ9652570.1 hypothetical protein [Psychroflexus montanilacus]
MRQTLKKHFINSRGKRTKDKILVIESDDWGAIRIPDLNSQLLLADKELINLKDPFSKYDVLEDEHDFNALFSVLANHQNSEGKNPIVTANMVMANPDFQKIKADNYANYHFEAFLKTYKSYQPHLSTYQKLKQGIQQELIYPQFHAREHLNVPMWLKRLKNKDQRFLEAFNLNCFAIDDLHEENVRGNLMASYDYESSTDLKFIEQSITEGLALFKEEFGFHSKSTIAPCYVWNDEVESIFKAKNVQHFQSSYLRKYNLENQLKHKRQPMYMGKKNNCQQTYAIRNVLFEPTLNKNINWVDKAMESIEIAFFWGKPAIIGTHRINYVGGLSKDNRNNSLCQLDELLYKVIKKWPEIQFLNSEELGKTYNNG